MELFRENNEESLSYLLEAISQPNVELEVIFGSHERLNPMNRERFLRVLDLCKKDYTLEKEETQLDIRQEFQKGRLSNVRCTISGMNDIKQYCKTDSVNGIESSVFVVKQPYKKDDSILPMIEDEDYNLRLALKQEQSLEPSHPHVIQALDQWSETNKHFRYKKRYSFQTPDSLYRIDMSVVKSTPRVKGKLQLTKRFREAEVLSAKETYELEIEYIGGSGSGTNYEHLFQLLKEQDYILSVGQKIPSNQYDPFLIDEPRYERDIGEEGALYMIESPRYKPLPGGVPENAVVYSQDEYSSMVGKYVKILDDYWRDNPSIAYIRSVLDQEKEKYLGNMDTFAERQTEFQDIYNQYKHVDGMIVDFEEIYDEKTESYKPVAKVNLYPPIDDVAILKVPLPQLYNESHPLLNTSVIPENPFPTETWKPEPMEGGAAPPAAEQPKITDNIKQVLPKKLLQILKEHIVHLSKCIYNTEELMSYKTKRMILSKYRKLTGQSPKGTFRLKGPQPVTLTKDHLSVYTKHNILVNYAVTEKADGERYQLYITKKRGYLINTKENVIDTGIIFQKLQGDWLLDGEYITKNKDNQPQKLFMAFDVYWNGNSTPQPIYTYPFIAENPTDVSRSLVLMRFQMDSDMFSTRGTRNVEIGVKEYEVGYINNEKLPPKDISRESMETILDASSQILEKSEEGYFPYRIDGLIYIPLYLSVRGSVSGSPVKNIGGEWKYNYKWKPPEENTIDFLVKTVKEKTSGGRFKDKIIPQSIQGEIKDTKEVGLYVMYDKNVDTNLNYCMTILQGNKEDISDEPIRLFQPPDVGDSVSKTNMVLDEGRMVCDSPDEETIRDGDIVEMRFNGMEAENGILWTPIRVRSDKTKAQFFTIAYNVWDTLMDPVTERMIRGDVKSSLLKKKPEQSDGAYYVTDADEQGGSVPLRKFNNMVKRKLIQGIGSLIQKPSICDVSCGRGGDIQKYLHKDVDPSFILGVDISTNVDEACKRYSQEATQVKAVFVRGDTSQNLRTGECSQITDITDKEKKHTQTMLQMIFSNERKPVPDEYSMIVPNYQGIATDGFDIVSSQFSIHYYFESPQTLDGFLRNVQECVKPGGYFIGTCYNGQRVFDLPEPTLEMKDETDTTIYSLTKKYSITDFTFNEGDDSNMFGNEIDVYMDSIGQVLTEYLVNFDYLTHRLGLLGFKPVIPSKVKAPYSRIFQPKYISDGKGDFELLVNDLKNLKESKDPDYKRSMDPLLGDSRLKPLISLNQYFVFQKE